MTVAFRAMLGAAGRDVGSGGGGGDPEYGILDVTSPASFSTTGQYGYAFTLSSPVTLNGLRVATNSPGSETVRLWRVSDESLVASSTISSPGSYAWAEEALGAPVALSAATEYVITTRRADGSSRGVLREPSSDITFNALVTYIDNRAIFADTYPSSTAGGDVLGLPDIVFTV